MIKPLYSNIYLKEPSILDCNIVWDMRKEFLSSSCKFNGTCDLDIYDNYIQWFAHTINQSHFCNLNDLSSRRKCTYLVYHINELIGMVEIIFSYLPNSSILHAHIIECIRPSMRRNGFGKPLLKKASHECRSFGVLKENITFERNSKASNDTMNRIMDF